MSTAGLAEIYCKQYKVMSKLSLDLDQDLEAPFDWNVQPAQRDFLLSTATFSCLSGGFGTGKTTVLCEKVSLLLFGIPGNLGYLGRLDGKALKQTTMVVLEEMLPKGSYSKNDQKGLLTISPEYGGSKLVYGDFKDLSDLKNHPLGFFGIDQMEETPEEVWTYLVGRLRRRVPILHEGRRQYRVVGQCPKVGGGRHWALRGMNQCLRCNQPLPPFDDKPLSADSGPPWDLIIYNRYGFGVANPEGPTHWIFKSFPNLPGQHGYSKGFENYAGYHASTYDGLRAGFIDTKYVKEMETKYQHDRKMFDRYILGKWVEANGLVYPGWDSQVNMIDSWQLRHDGSPLIPEGSSAYEYIDHGLTAPTAIGWVVPLECQCGCNKTDFFVIAEHYVGGRGTAYHAQCMKAIRAQHGLPILGTFLDAQAFSASQTRSNAEIQANPKLSEIFSYADQYIDENIYVLPNQKDWDAGYDRITELLVRDPTHTHPLTGEKGAPHLYVFSICKYFKAEIEGYVWKKVKATDTYKEEPVDRDDHHMDGFNGFLTSRPGTVTRVDAGQKDDRLLKELAELDLLDGQASHMAA
jgi:hypothetical protein